MDMAPTVNDGLYAVYDTFGGGVLAFETFY